MPTLDVLRGQLGNQLAAKQGRELNQLNLRTVLRDAVLLASGAIPFPIVIKALLDGVENRLFLVLSFILADKGLHPLERLLEGQDAGPVRVDEVIGQREGFLGVEFLAFAELLRYPGSSSAGSCAAITKKQSRCELLQVWLLPRLQFQP